MNLKKISQRFAFCYKNTAFYDINKIFAKNGISYFLIYNDNRAEIFNKINASLKLDKDIEICYNSINSQISSVVSLQNQIRKQKYDINRLNDEICQLNDEICQLNGEICQLNSEIYQLKSYNNQFQLSVDYKLSLIEIKCLNVNEESIKKVITKNKKNNSISYLISYKKCNNLFVKSYELSTNIYPKENFICLNDEMIGKKEIPPNYLNLIRSLEEKISEETFDKEYYKAYLRALSGKEYATKNVCYFLICDEIVANVLKNILKSIKSRNFKCFLRGYFI